MRSTCSRGPFEGDQAALVKPSTVVNGLAAAMMRLRADAKAVVMHAPVDDFVTSIAKKGLDGRLWARELFIGMRERGWSMASASATSNSLGRRTFRSRRARGSASKGCSLIC